MKHSVKAILAMLLAAACLLSVVAAGAEGGKMTYQAWKDRLLNTQKIVFENRKAGLGLGDLPVYTAPSTDSLRFANNRQKIDTDRGFYEAGKTESGWLLVRYDPGNNTIRTGYIPPDKISKVKAKTIDYFDSIDAIAASPIRVTDDPINGSNIFVTLQEGEPFTILAKYTFHGNWWYIECTAQGKTARGFIDREKSRFLPGDTVEDNLNQEPVSILNLGYPTMSPNMEERIGEVMIPGSKKDARKSVYTQPLGKGKAITVVYPGKTYGCYAEQTGKNGKSWYYIYVEEESTWAWISGDFAKKVN